MRQRVVELREGVHLDLDLHQVPDALPDAADGLRDPPGQGHVVVLDEDGVVQAVAVGAAAAHAHGVLLEGAQARRRLARAGDPGLEAFEARHHVAGRGGDPADVAEEVESGALGGQERTRRGGHAREGVAFRDVAPVAEAHVDPALRIEQPERVERGLETGHAAGRARHHRRLPGEVGRRDRVRRDVAGATEVLEQGAADDVLVEQGQERRRLVHA